MPAFDGVAAGHEMETKKHSKEDIAAGVTNSLLMLIVIVFTLGSLWLGIFAIPAFFAFFRASVVTISSIREVRASRQLGYSSSGTAGDFSTATTVFVVVGSVQQQFGIGSVLDVFVLCLLGDGSAVSQLSLNV